MIDKIKKYQHSPFFKQIQDVRVLSLVAFGVLALMVSWSTISSIQTNYALQKQIAQLRQQNKVDELKNKNQALTNQYYDTDQFLELAARQHFGKAAPGEKVLLVPKNVALAHTVETSSTKAAPATESSTSSFQRNFEAWMDFFLHRQG
jgi:cell division protein FtsB